MSLFRSAFSFKKTKPRKLVSKSPLKLSADQLQRDLGPRCEAIDIKVADQKITFDIEHGDWNTGTVYLSPSLFPRVKEKRSFRRSRKSRRNGVEQFGEQTSQASRRSARREQHAEAESGNSLESRGRIHR